MGRLIDDLLRLARVTRSELTLADLDLSQIAEQVVTELRQREPAHNPIVEVAPGLRCLADPVLLRTALENLIGNAWKYSSRNPGARIQVGQMECDGESVYFVRDNGTGFDMRYENKLFGAFQRLHGAEFPGSGIGLATVQRIIHRHGGRVWAQGEVGKGATFYFTMMSEPAVSRSAPLS
jgi:light-regulated signal transduction histidine kinase (bacteriophytochrome)